MDIKKIGITGVIGFVSTAIMGGINTALYYQKHMTGVADKFPGIVQFPPDVASAMIGMVVYVFVMAIIYDKMGVSGLENGAITGAWFGSAKWFFFNTQMAAIMPEVWGDWNYIAIDIALTAVMYGVSGAAMGWSLERFKS